MGTAICGMAAAKNAAGLIEEPVLRAMAVSQLLGSDEVVESVVVPQFGLASVSRSGKTFHCCEQVVVACDADLYKCEETRHLLGLREPASAARCIANLYLEYGQDFLHRLRGVFAIALWDRRSCVLLLARDRFGVRPLCYASADSAITFGSHPTGILRSGRVERRVNLKAIADYLHYSVVPAPLTAFEGITKVNAGECVMWKDGVAHKRQYWDLQYPEDAQGNHEQLAQELLTRMEEAVRVTATGLTPERTGCFLSGGTDSGSVVGLLTRIQGPAVNTFSIGFSDTSFNELEYARIASHHFRSKHHEATVTPEIAYEAIDKIVGAYDEPFGNSSAVPTYCCARLARDHGVEVLLAGDGGDELFGGNERYEGHQAYALYHQMPCVVRRSVIEPIVFAGPASLKVVKRARRYIRRTYIPNPDRFCIMRNNLLQDFPLEQVLQPGMPMPADRIAILRAYYQAVAAKSELNRLLYVDIKMALGDEDLRKVVRASELADVKVRFPYLDHPLAEFSGRLPANLKVRGLQKRYLFKRAVRHLLPPAILRKKKHGFGIPIGLWLKTEPKLRSMTRDVLLDPKTYQRGYFRLEFVEQLLLRLDGENTTYTIYYGDLLFTFLMLELWHRRHMEAEAAPA